MTTKVSIIIFLGLVTLLSFGQPINFTVEDGLPSNTVYHIHQSSSGYIWFSTDNGISRFDGKKFINYSEHDGLPDIDIFELYEDSRKRVWMFTSNGHIGYFTNDRNPEFFLIDTLSFQDRITHIAEKSDGSVWMSSKNSGIVSISEQLQLTKLPIGDQSVYSFFFNTDGAITYFTPNVYRYQKGVSTELFKPFFKVSPNSRVEMHENFAFVHTIGTKDFKRINLTNFEFDTFRTKEPILNFYEDEGDLAIFYSNGYSQFKSESFSYQSLPAFRFSDKDKFIWTSTLQNGVWLTNPISELAIDEIELGGAEIHDITIDSNLLQVTYNSNELDSTIFTLPVIERQGDDALSLFTRNSFLGYLSSAQKSNSGITKISGWHGLKPDLINFWTYYKKDVDSEDINIASFAFYQPFGWIVDDNNNFWEFGPRVVFINSRNFDCELQAFAKIGSKMLLAESNQLLVFNISHHLDSTSVDTLNIQGIKSILPINDRICWVAGRNGLTKLNVNTYQSETIVHFSDDNIIEIIKGMGGYVLNIRDKGICIMDDTGIHRFSKTNGLFQDNIKYIAADINEVWISSSTGLNKITKSPEGFAVSTVTSLSDFSSSHFNDMEIFNDQLHLATDTGLIIMKKGFEQVGQKYLIKDQLKITVDDSQVHEFNEISIPYNHFEIRFDYEVIAPANFNDIIYAFQLQRKKEGHKSQWIESKDPRQEFSNLKPGDYTFYAKSRASMGNWFHAKPIHFSVRKPFWQNPIYYVLTTILISLIVGLSLRRRQLIRERIQLLNLEISDSKLLALRSQINPHFIFNSLNSIRMFMLQKDFENADKYLTEMSKLLRELFEGSNEMLISLDKELKHLKLYLSLEQMRFKERFSYHFVLDEQLDPGSMKIPSMMIQPILENAIWHGFGNPSQKGQIDIIFDLTDEFLKIDIIDNGKGFKYEPELIKLSGLKIVKDRINLLNEIHNSDGGLVIESQEEKGTIVSISIPRDIVTDD